MLKIAFSALLATTVLSHHHGGDHDHDHDRNHDHDHDHDEWHHKKDKYPKYPPPPGPPPAPVLSACRSDIEQFCSKADLFDPVPPMHCLYANAANVSSSCYDALQEYSHYRAYDDDDDDENHFRLHGGLVIFVAVALLSAVCLKKACLRRGRGCRRCCCGRPTPNATLQNGSIVYPGMPAATVPIQVAQPVNEVPMTRPTVVVHAPPPQTNTVPIHAQPTTMMYPIVTAPTGPGTVNMQGQDFNYHRMSDHT